LNVHRVVVTSVLLAAKFFDDAYYNNAYYAKVGGVLVHEMNGLEVDFLFRINFSLHATPDEFTKYRNELLSHASMGVLSNDLPLMYDDHDGIAVDSTTSPPPAQVSPEIHFSTTPNLITSASMAAIDHQHNTGPYPTIQEPPSSTKQQQRDAVMIVPPDVDCAPTQKNHQSEYAPPSQPSYFGFPLHPQPSVYHHNRRNSMPPVIPQDTASLISASTSSPQQQQYQPPSAIHSGMPKSDPIRSVSARYSNNNINAINNYLQPTHCIPHFPVYNNNMDATTTSSSSSNVTTSTASNLSLSSSSNYYSGNLILMDHENRIQQPLHLWDGTPITIVQHHHHGTQSTNNNNAYDASSVGYTAAMTLHHHQQQQHHHHQSQPVEVVAVSGVGGLR
jgi:Cyclin